MSDDLKREEELLIFDDEEDDCLLFEDEDEEVDQQNGENDLSNLDKWKILIVDDEQEIHNVTKMVLDDFVFDGKQLEFIHAYSGKEAMETFKEQPDISLTLLDVVMEEDDAGLNVVKYVRDELKNKNVRIILRTGQPGQAPEKVVIADYDINDYKEKTELTSQKLFTTIISALRSYRDIKIIENNKQGLENIIQSAPNIFKLQSMKKFASGVLQQLTSLLILNKNALHCNSIAVTMGNEDFYVLAATGDYEKRVNSRVRDVVEDDIYALIQTAFNEKRSYFDESHIVCYFQSNTGADNVIYLHGRKGITEFDRFLIDIYCTNVSVAFENIYLNEELEKTQREIIFTMGEIAETRSKETGFHVKRVAEYSKLLALKSGFSDEEAEMLRLASPMHDVGKVGIPDTILNKPGKLSDEEYELMKVHSKLGYDMLKHSNREILNAAAIIALEHHEKYNGRGYPNGKKGEDIHMYGRIVAIADVFDALGTERVYKKAWELDRIVNLFKEERGEHFDPKLVDIFLEHLDEFVAIKDRYNDEKVF